KMMDQAWSEQTGLPLLQLMEQAATAVCRFFIDRVLLDERSRTSILVLAGKGQNGGDAYAAARLLTAENFPVTVVDVFPDSELPAEARMNREAWLRLGHEIRTDLPFENPDSDLLNVLASPISYRCPMYVIDGIFGTGYRADRPLPGRVLAWTRQLIHWRQAGTRVVAIDLPSGVDADTAQIAPGAVQADATVTMVRPKTGISATPGRFAAGDILVDRIGIPDFLVENLLADRKPPVQIDPAMIRQLRITRHPNSHKGTFGRVLVLGGSAGLPGAAALAAEAASRAGAGLVYLGTGESVAPQVLAAVADALLTALPENEPDRLPDLLSNLVAGKQVVAIGPGAGKASWLNQALAMVLEKSPQLIIDADGLNSLARDMELYQTTLLSRRLRGLEPAILTPHPGEFARLAPDLDWSDRQLAAAQLAARLDSIVLLKGASTVITHPDGRIWINPTGNAGLAKGGSGDVLCGLIAGLCAQGLGAFEAAAAGAYLHGLAADLAADLASGGTGSRSLLPGDVLRAFGRAFAVAGWET
ncbi:MAG: NAD(P)H-hydrate dehydratase, partial [Clostridia bacterium]|nr:NAD(P)H-hydrate dehydratase [Clostridia bacterium]